MDFFWFLFSEMWNYDERPDLIWHGPYCCSRRAIQLDCSRGQTRRGGEGLCITSMIDCIVRRWDKKLENQFSLPNKNFPFRQLLRTHTHTLSLSHVYTHTLSFTHTHTHTHTHISLLSVNLALSLFSPARVVEEREREREKEREQFFGTWVKKISFVITEAKIVDRCIERFKFLITSTNTKRTIVRWNNNWSIDQWGAYSFSLLFILDVAT